MTYEMQRKWMKPWVGKNYGRPNDLDLPRRLLILGESHYDGDATDQGYTEFVVRQILKGDRKPFFTKLEKAILVKHFFGLQP